ncbi:Cytochrome P450 71D8 [Hordeum vulgare]|nr:Cytochrome P450 71D8 [Hordeum vulgare]
MSNVPMAQRASLRIVKEPGLLGPKEKMTTKVAKSLLRHFDKPLMDSDIVMIAKLMRLDNDALRVAAHMAEPDGATKEAIV